MFVYYRQTKTQSVIEKPAGFFYAVGMKAGPQHLRYPAVPSACGRYRSLPIAANGAAGTGRGAGQFGTICAASWVATLPRPFEYHGPRPKVAKPHAPRENLAILLFRDCSLATEILGQLTFCGELPGRCKLKGLSDHR